MNSIVTSTSAVVMRLLTDADRALDADRGAAKTYIAQAAAILREEDDRFVPASEVTRISSRGRLAQWQIHKVCAYVEQNLDQEIRASTLASLSRLSASYFPVTFKRSGLRLLRPGAFLPRVPPIGRTDTEPVAAPHENPGYVTRRHSGSTRREGGNRNVVRTDNL